MYFRINQIVFLNQTNRIILPSNRMEFRIFCQELFRIFSNCFPKIFFRKLQLKWTIFSKSNILTLKYLQSLQIFFFRIKRIPNWNLLNFSNFFAFSNQSNPTNFERFPIWLHLYYLPATKKWRFHDISLLNFYHNVFQFKVVRLKPIWWRPAFM